MHLRLLLVSVLAVAAYADPIFFKKSPKKAPRPSYGYHHAPAPAPAPVCYPETQYIEVPVTKVVEQDVYVTENLTATFYETKTISTTQTLVKTSMHAFPMYVTETKTRSIPMTRTVNVVETQSIYVTETQHQALIMEIETHVVALTETHTDTMTIFDKQYLTETQTMTMFSIFPLTQIISMTVGLDNTYTETHYVLETDIQIQTSTLVNPVTITEIENAIIVESLVQTVTQYTTETSTKTISMIQNRVVTKPFLKNNIVTETKKVCDYSNARVSYYASSPKHDNRIVAQTKAVYDNPRPWFAENVLSTKFEFPDFISEFRHTFGTSPSPLKENALDLNDWPKWKK